MWVLLPERSIRKDQARAGNSVTPSIVSAPQQLEHSAGVPIPSELAAEGQQIESAVQQSIQESQEKGLAGAETTPFLLKRIQDLTGGSSLAANISLIKHNAAVGSQIAVALCQQSKS